MENRRHAWFLAALASSAIGCAGIEVRPGEQPAIPPDEGLLTFAIQADSIVYANIVGRDGGSGFTINPFFRGMNLRTYHVPAGTYCIQQLTFQASTMMVEPEPCFAVAASEVTLVGFVESGERILRTIPGDEVARLFAEAHPQLASAYPRQRAVEIELPQSEAVPRKIVPLLQLSHTTVPSASIERAGRGVILGWKFSIQVEVGP